MENLLRPSWLELKKRVDPELICDDLYYHGIIELDEMEKITTHTTRRKRASELMYVISTRPFADVIKFAEILKTKKGIKDIGKTILQRASSKSKKLVSIEI